MRTGWIAAAAAAVLALGGCGDSGGGSSKTTSVSVKPSVTAPPTTTTQTTTTPSSAKKATKAEVVATADKACKESKTKSNRLARVGSVAEQIAALLPETDDRRIAKYVDVLNNELGLLRRLDYARKHKQSSQVEFLQGALAKQRHRARILARDYGLTVCGGAG